MSLNYCLNHCLIFSLSNFFIFVRYIDEEELHQYNPFLILWVKDIDLIF